MVGGLEGDVDEFGAAVGLAVTATAACGRMLNQIIYKI